jgi:glycosyltransferase involved in cell wall biosynthesis
MEVTHVAVAIPDKKDGVTEKHFAPTVVGETPRVDEPIGVALLTGGFDRPYAFGLAMALAAEGLQVDVIGSDEIDSPEMHLTSNLNFLNLFGSKRSDVSIAAKVARVLRFYVRLVKYVGTAAPPIVHILWNNKLQYFDRTLLMLIYKLLGKKIVLTAHNVNAGKRDSNDSLLNRVTLKMQYRLADHIFVHTEKSKSELVEDFGVRKQAVTVIPFGINNSVPNTQLTPAEARQRLGIGPNEKTILFFGAIRPYKGLEYLVSAFQRIAPKHADYRLIIAGEPKKGCEEYLQDIQGSLSDLERARVLEKIEYVSDEETELYFKAADVSVLPYTLVFQSGVLFLSYSFGLPVIASDVGSFRDDIVEGETGFVCTPCDPEDLAKTIEKFFESDLFKTLDRRRREIQDYAHQRNSWKVVAEQTRRVYAGLIERQPS